MQKSYAIELLSSPIFSRLHYGRWLRWKKEFIKRLLKTRRYESFSFQSLIQKKSSFKRRLVDNILSWRSFWGHTDIRRCLNENILCLGAIIYELSNGYEVFLFPIIYFQFWHPSPCFTKSRSNKLVRKRPNIIKIDYQSLAIRLPCRTDRITPSFSFSMSESEASWPWKVVILIRCFSLEESV